MSDDLDTFVPTRGSARELVGADELVDPADRAAVVLDRRRRRPRYFDDRFLTARDLSRGQQYTLLRQADLAQLSGAGVVRGMEVSTDAKGVRLEVGAGMGIARTGESIALREDATIRLSKLRVVAGNSPAKSLVADQASERAKTGLFMLVARPVEHSRSPEITFPTGTVVGHELADAEIVEGTWFTLTPLPSQARKDVTTRGRARLAREIFLGGFDPTALTDGMALAVLGIVGSRVQWVDQAMVARNVGGDGVVGFGVQRRKDRLAYQAQYTEHLAEVIERRRSAGLPDGLPATEAFDALPPVGSMPRGAVEVTANEIRQTFFPPEIYVEIAIMPEDEVPALLAEGLVRAPIDLQSGPEALEGVPVLIVVPVPRAGFDQRTPRMEGVYHGPKLVQTGRSLVNARPIDALAVLRLKNETASATNPMPLDLEAWRKAVETAPQLWYVRRPQFATTSAVVPRIAPPSEEVEPLEPIERTRLAVRTRIDAAAERARFNHLFSIANEQVLSNVNSVLSGPVFAAEDGPADAHAPANDASIYVSGFMGELAYMVRRAPPSDPVGSPRGPLLSPSFDDRVTTEQFRFRPLEMSDIDRVALRYAAEDVGTSLRGPLLRDPALRSVLATLAVVPELAVWAASPEGIDRGGVKYIASLAAEGKISALRELAKTVTTLETSNDPRDDGGGGGGRGGGGLDPRGPRPPIGPQPIGPQPIGPQPIGPQPLRTRSRVEPVGPRTPVPTVDTRRSL